jgi:antitoxin (DNA-binding transcriptional repressor) of toxin-antitoxin stability system
MITKMSFPSVVAEGGIYYFASGPARSSGGEASFLPPIHSRFNLDSVKTATVQELPTQWPQILKWIAAGEEVHLTEHNHVVAKVVPASALPVTDFVGRAKAIWGEIPEGQTLSSLVSANRGGSA